MAKASELRDMSDEQIGLTLKEANENLFRLRIKQQTERLDAPSFEPHLVMAEAHRRPPAAACPEVGQGGMKGRMVQLRNATADCSRGNVSAALVSRRRACRHPPHELALAQSRLAGQVLN